ncbi:hypothetical protein F2P45_23445 [Massilia sp. CCM 8733]|uniref:Uncharacterized protein n=1 Tax=Massilia mucilaginosa TaxID=2609282 RepID=A0ABX0NYJ9_9BURK|nr:hypothetical protein [Massilia mucilaginosa]NHZ91937.1 hypothetical protein [Massilia mucilaginosa]
MPRNVRPNAAELLDDHAGQANPALQQERKDMVGLERRRNLRIRRRLFLLVSFSSLFDFHILTFSTSISTRFRPFYD